MESLSKILAALIVWRLLLSAGVSIVLALVLSNAIAAFTAGYCITLVLLGTGFGIIWHSRAEAGVGLLAPVQPPTISKPVAFLGLLLIGFFWGSFASGFLGSPILGGVALVCAVVVVGLWYRFVLRRLASVDYLAFACASLLSGLALLLLLKASNA